MMKREGQNMESRTSAIYLFLFSFVVSASVVSAHIGDPDDEYWINRAKAAREIAEKSYNPDPFGVTSSFNAAVHKSLAKNMTGRSLRRIYSGPCQALNPIDRCWRCRADWANNRQHLASCAKGFGRLALGAGKYSEIYTVTDPSDNDVQTPKEGTLRWACIQDRPLWIIFAHDMVIRINQELLMTSHKTIDGRGANVRIAFGSSFSMQFVSNIIIHGVHIHNIVSKEGGMVRDSEKHVGIRTRSDGDGISIFGASNIWIDHVSMSRCDDGLIDVIQGSTAITISNSHFTQHNDVMLFGASDSYEGDSIMQITVAFNHFGQNLVQRMPRVRWGYVHVVNNDYTHWLMYAVGGSRHPTVISQGNRYTAPVNPNAKEVTKRDYAPESVWSSWNWTSENDLYRNGAFFRASGVRSSDVLTRNFSRYDVIRAKPGSFVTRLTRFSGALDCKVGHPC